MQNFPVFCLRGIVKFSNSIDTVATEMGYVAWQEVRSELRIIHNKKETILILLGIFSQKQDLQLQPLIRSET